MKLPRITPKGSKWPRNKKNNNTINNSNYKIQKKLIWPVNQRKKRKKNLGLNWNKTKIKFVKLMFETTKDYAEGFKIINNWKGNDVE